MTGARSLAARLDARQRRSTALGFLVAVARKFSSDGAGRLAAVLAYYTFFSLFPLLLVVTTVLGRALSHDSRLRAELVDSVLAQFPVVGTTLRDGGGPRPLQGSALAAVVGIVGALWGGLRAMQAAQHALNDVWDVPMRDRPNALRLRARALATLAVVGAFLLGTVALANLTALSPVAVAGRVGLGLGTFVADVLTFLVAFRVLTARRVPWRDHVPGAVVAGAGWFLIQLAGTWFVARVIRGASDVYGTFATVIGFLTLFHAQAQVSLVAAEVNVVRARRLWPRSLTGRDLTEADRRALHDEASAVVRYPGERIAIHVDDD